MMNWLLARWAERSTKLALAAVCAFAGAWSSGQVSDQTALYGIAYALAHALMPDNVLVQAMGIAAPSAPVLDPNKLKSLAAAGLLAFGALGLGALGGCAMTNANGQPLSPAQKFTAACDEYNAGAAALGPLIQAVAAKQGATAAKIYTAAQTVIGDACAKNSDGTYLNASNPATLATLLPQVLAAAGQLAVLFIPAS